MLYDQMNRSKKMINRFAAVLIAVVAMSGAVSAADCEPGVLDIRDSDTTLRFNVEVMDTEDGRANGLMHRESMPRFSGMLFVYDAPGPVAFWMRNTLIPLDMLFFDASGKLQRIHENAVPKDETPVPGGNDIQYVLEINGGMSSMLGIDGDAVIRHPSITQDGAAWSCAG
jgi:uncharacterized membrane protein (UPF0127 family)